MRRPIASGLYSCKKHHYKHRTVERFYLEFVGHHEMRMSRDAAKTIKYLGDLFFSDQHYRKDRIVSFRPSRQNNGFYLVVGRMDSYKRVIDMVDSLCGFIVKTDKIEANETLDNPDLASAKMLAAYYQVFLHKPVRL